MTIDETNVQDVIEHILKQVPEYGTVDAVLTYKTDGTKRAVRFAKSHGSLIAMLRRSRKYGQYVDKYYLRYFSSIEIKSKTPVSEEEKWRKSWTQVRDRLAKSGLWQDWLKEIDDALEIGMDKIKQAYTAYWDGDLDQETERVKAVEPRLIDINKDGKEYPRTNILWYMNKPAKIKKMYFGKYDNERNLAQIAAGMERKTPVKVWGKASYDVSFEYNPELNKAWYSEEYRGCGNGHYYLAVDATHAVFYEDD